VTNDLRTVLQLVESGRITPEEGQRRMRALRDGPAAHPPAGKEGGGRVAVIGMSARYAGADDTDALWRLLIEGRSAVREVPAARWDARRFYDPDPRTPGRTNCVRGGFLDGIDRFDPLFFALSGREAEAMDPQQRLFLEACWTALEDAGYAGDSVSGVSCGVYAGAPASDYATESERCGVDSDARVLMGNDTAILAARISYLLNLRGPSLALNTACSSSLVAVHLAAQAISSGECEMALAGGVCLFVSPGFYLSASTADMLSPDGECFAFDERANGFVPGEGVGVVVLKDLDAALRDGDDIRGVLIGSAINQDGKTNGITAPSARAQHAVHLAAYRAAGITPDTIGMVEAHGTGTALGDPIEIDALTRSFAGHGQTPGHCAIGSIKTNIGHTGQAAGVAGLLKVLLALEHGTIPPTCNFERANSRIDFAGSPFRVATEAVPWPAVAGAPRRAVVSSFGYSGTNAHIVVEEPPAKAAAPQRDGHQLILLSAKTDEALRTRMLDLADWADARGDGARIADIAFTLHTGRKHFARRAAFVVGSAAELSHVLRTAASLPEGADIPVADGSADALRRAAAAYTAGDDVDPAAFHPGLRGSRVALPTYPYARERYWSRPAEIPAASTGISLERIADATYAYRPASRDPLVADHVVGGSAVLAAMVSVELAATAVAAVAGEPVTGLTDLTWNRPLRPLDGDGLLLRITPDADGFAVTVDAASGSAPGPAISATATTAADASPWPTLDIAEITARLTSAEDGAGKYRQFRSLGIVHGPAFHVLEEIRAGDGEVLATLRAPDTSGYRFHPFLLDGALQAVIGLAADPEAIGGRLPRSLDSLRLRGSLPASCVAHLRQVTPDTVDIDVADREGAVLIALRGLRVAEAPTSAPVLLSPRWKPTLLPARAPSQAPVLVLDDGDALRSALAQQTPGRVVLARPGDRFERTGPADFRLRPGSAEDMAALLADLDGERPRLVVIAWDSAEDTEHLRTLHTLIAAGQALGGARDRGPTALRFIHPAADRLPPATAGLAGAARTLRREDPDLLVQVIGVASAADGHTGLLLAEPDPTDPTELLIDATGATHRLDFDTAAAPGAPARAEGVHVISGGAGAVGLAIAGHLADQGASVVLLGRSARDMGRRTPEGGAVEYQQVDITHRDDLARVLADVRGRLGAIRGVVHAAGVVRDAFLRDKTPADVDTVLAAKITGARLLDELTAEDPVDTMLLCSSAVAVVGNPGQVDYGFANAYLDAFAAERSARGRRTVSVGWPAWSGAGMAADAGLAEHAISSAEALDLLDAALASTEPHLLALKAGGRALTRLVSPALPADLAPADGQHPADLHAVAEELLIRVLAEELRVPADRIGAHEPLEIYGIDSVMVMQLSRRLETEFGRLPKTLFFEYLTLAELAGYFADRHAHRLTVTTEPAATPDPEPRTHQDPAPRPEHDDPQGGDIAIIGIAGRYPGAEDIEQYWDNLVRGRDCVTEIPAERWPLDGFYAPEPAAGLSYSKWGGFLTGIDEFDPVFFGIAPREADMLDPQERLFLQIAWHALEDAAYPPSALRGQRTGVYVGVMYGHYQLIGAAPDGRMPVSSFASIANRVSYLFDLRGPSLAVDTMCSSSLTAIHLACAALRRGECDTAVAGGVNLTPHPDKYRQLSLGGFAASDGRCRSFGDGGDGYVPGEGVGAVVLKPLARAVADGDHIHAVIRGSALNHGGKTNGYTVPNPRAQASAITSAMAEARVTGDDIGYVEAHGTGTALGDPIEVNALTRAYGELAEGGRRIPIGSAKSAIGHLESAAGIAAVTKVVLQLRHRTLPPTLHAETLNPNIDFAASPLSVQRTAAPWLPADGQDRLTAGISSFGAGGANAHLVLSEPPPHTPAAAPGGPRALLLSAKSEEALRGLAAQLARLLKRTEGTVHDAVTTDLLDRIRPLLGLRTADLGPHDPLGESGFDEVVRAKLGADLADAYGLPLDDLPATADTAGELADHLVRAHEAELRAHFGVAADGTGKAPCLADVAHTLHRGREQLNHRLAVVATTTDEAAAELTAFAAGEPTGLAGRADGEPVTAPQAQDLRALAAAWVRGADIDWSAHLAGGARIPLTRYPFARERHWLDVDLGNTPRQLPSAEPPITAESPADLLQRVEDILRALAAEAIGLDPRRFDPLVNLGDYGFESLTFKTLGEQISDRFGVEFSPTVFFERSGLRGAAAWLVDEHPATVAAALRTSVPASVPATASARAAGTSSAEPSGDSGDEPIAVIGMSGRFPGAEDLDGFWANLRDQRDLVTEIPAERWDWRELDRDDLPADQRCPFRWGAFLDGVDEFDPLFFGISPAEAEMMDPQQRLLLQTAWAAIEDAGYRPSSLAGHPVGLFAGIQFNDYQHLLHEAGVLNAQAALGNEHSISVNRISYLLDLRGPSEPVNTACSSSLVAVHRAVRSLRLGESTVALAGGIALNLSSHSTVAAGMMGLLSPDGRCKTLSAGANGYVKGEGVGLLVLKPLSRARADGDNILAVIRGTSVNHGGRAASLTAPNSAAQSALIQAAVTESGVAPDSLGYLELHGTGTELGDPVEISGITSAFRALHADAGLPAPARPYCGIGSVKTNIGHLEPASGIAGLIKIILSIRHRTLPGMAHLGEVNPYVRLDRTPFYIVEQTSPWEPRTAADGSALPLRAGVSSFGFGGVNAHVLVEEHRSEPPARSPEPAADQVFVLSARTEDALTVQARRLVERLNRWAADGQGPDPAAVAATLHGGREEHDHRLAVVAADLGALRTALSAVLAGTDTNTDPGSAVHRGTAREGVEQAGSSADDLAWAWVQGASVTWPAAPGTKVSLPTYPFAGKRYWFTATGRPKAIGAAATAPAVSGEDAVRLALRTILMDKLKLADSELDDDRDLKDFGVDSILSAMIMQLVQDKFGVQVSLSALVDHPSVGKLAKHLFHDVLDGVAPEVVAGMSGSAAAVVPRADGGLRFPPELLPINTEGSGQISFWVHGAAGYSSWFDNLSRALGPEYPLYAFQAKGTDGHSMPQLMDEMADHYVECIRMVQPEGPYVIGGYSFGGLVAMEIARRLQAAGDTVRHLIMFDTYPATQEVFDRHVGIYDEDFLRFYLINYFLKIDEHPERAIRPAELKHLPSSLREQALCKLAKERGQKRISADDIYLYLRGGLNCSAHSEGMYQTYDMRPYDASDVLFFKATDGFTGRASAAYWPSTRILDGYDYLTPWRDIVAGRFDTVELDNDHLNMLEDPTLDLAVRHIGAVLRQPPDLDGEAYSRFRQGFDAVTAFGHELLAGGLLGGVEGKTSRAELSERVEIGDSTAATRLFDASVDILLREGFLERDGESVRATDLLDAVDLDDEAVAARAARLGEQHPEAADYLPLLIAAQAALPAVLAGERSGTDALMPGGSMELVAELYKGNVQTEYYNRLAVDRVIDRVRRHVRRFPHSTAQIFEVGAGTGGTSEFLFGALRPHADRLRYYFTDIGGVFVDGAEQRFSAEVPYARFLTHDIERTPESQGIEPHSMDIVIASNVLHATRRVADTVAHCARLLKPTGALVINELTHRLDYNTLTFGLTEGWWLFEDDALRIPGSPLLSAPTWRSVLADAGLGEVEVHGVPGACEDEQAQCVIVATRCDTTSGGSANEGDR
jgi:acyl transferase domain-containing protein/thioesterase domain-containing protein/SAM-dependent methyltransferase